MTDAENYQKLKEIALAEGMNLFGVADIKNFRNEIFIDHKAITDYRYAVCMGLALSSGILNTIADKPNRIYFRHYKMVNTLLDQVALKITSFIQDKGHLCLPIPASQVLDWEKQTAHLSHRTAGYYAGLGWRGKNNLLINLGFGSQVRYVTCLTNMSLRADKIFIGSCADCNKCIQVCPAGALSEEGYDKEKCHTLLKKFAKEEKVALICGVCLRVCSGKNNRDYREE